MPFALNQLLRPRGVAFLASLISGPTLAQSVVSFTEITSQAGLGDALRGVAPGGLYGSMHGGGVVADFNNDGYHDIFMLAGGLYDDYLYINNGDGTFTNRASDWGVAYAHHSFGASAADFNNDGYLDVFITSYGRAGVAAAPGKMILYQNNGPDAQGQWSFTDVAVECGVNRLFENTRDGIGSGWGDIDLDGDLDLYICGYNEVRACNRLFRNDGPDAQGRYTFTDITVEAGLELHGVSGFLPQIVDMNGDRYPELIVVADTGTSRVFTNNGDGTFTDTSSTVDALGTANGMGIDIGDVNNDGLLDMYISSITYTFGNSVGNLLLLQNPDGSYTNTGQDNGTSHGYWGWGVLMADFDHDRDLDIAETNGGVGSFATDPSVLFENLGDGTAFNEIAQNAGFIHDSQGRGLVRIDVENDGDLDMIIFENNGHLWLYRNNLMETTGSDNRHWARITLDTQARDTLAPNGIGAMVRLTADGQTQLLPMHCGSSHASASPIEIHAGLGSATQIDRLQIAWADGSFTTMSHLPIDQVINISAPATPVDYVPDAVTNYFDVLAFITLYQNADFGADHNGDSRLNFFDIADFISDYRTATLP